MQDKDIYWSFVGIGNEQFTYLRELANKLPNVGFFDIHNLDEVKDMELYKQLLSNEVSEWFKKF